MDSVRISDTMNMDRIIHGHWRLMDWKMTPEELPDYAGLTTCRVIDYIPEWRRKEAKTAPQKRPPLCFYHPDPSRCCPRGSCSRLG